MKKSNKLEEPQTLEKYRRENPSGLWERMRNDPENDGQQAYYDVKNTLVQGQRGLCAYCETQITDSFDDEIMRRNRHRQRVEHFHNKSDLQGPVNWALHWPNMWAVCQGGSQLSLDTRQYLPPLPDNLSCDAFKEYQISNGLLPPNPEGYILSPDEMPAFPLLIRFEANGTPFPDEQKCTEFEPLNNHYEDTTRLVAETIEHLNLGCSRLRRNRSIALAQLEKTIEKHRKLAPGLRPQQVLLRIAQGLFRQNVNTPWPEFFSLIRWRLGEAAEQHLRSIQFDG